MKLAGHLGSVEDRAEGSRSGRLGNSLRSRSWQWPPAIHIAERYAKEHGIPRVHASYKELVEDGDLDAIYIALPVSEHAEWSIAALEAGRHVLCEKPFACNATEAMTMIEAAQRSDRHIVEAMHWRYHPMADRLIELGKLIGPLREGEGRFEAALYPDDIRFRRDLGGGATMDVGCYAVHWLRTVTGEEPEVVSAVATEGPVGVDAAMTATLRFPSGCVAQMSCAMRHPDEMDVPVRAAIEMAGENGWFMAVNPQAPQFGSEIRTKLAGVSATEPVVDGDLTYPYQLQARVRRGSWPEKKPRSPVVQMPWLPCA